jgi:hypothetical protein
MVKNSPRCIPIHLHKSSVYPEKNGCPFSKIFAIAKRRLFIWDICVFQLWDLFRSFVGIGINYPY